MREKKNIIELTRVTRDEYRALRKLPLTVLTDNVRSAQNIGSIFRTADAMKVARVVLGGISPVPPSPEISKTALGAEESVEWRHVADAVAEVRRLKSEGMKVYVLEQAHGSVDLRHLGRVLDRDAGSLLVVGNEVNGVDQRIVDMADTVLEIPMHGVKHSLNVSVSAGIALWEFYREFI